MLLPQDTVKSVVARLRQLPQQGYQQLSLALPEMDLLAWLNQQNHNFRGYWKSKQGDEAAWLGAAESLNDLEQVQATIDALDTNDHSLRFYGGIAFTRQSATWPSFPRRRFVLPRIEIRQKPGSCEMIINANFRNRPEHEYQCITGELEGLARIQPLADIRCDALSRIDQPSRDQWQQLVDEVTGGDFQQHTAKVVLSRQTTIALKGTLNPFSLLNQWQQREQDCYSFLFQFDGLRSFVGCSPERLYARCDTELLSEALAGTAPRGQTVQQDCQLGSQLLNDHKNQWENQVVLDDLSRRLQELSLHVNPDAELELVKLKHVQHLKRRITAMISPELDDLSLLDALHPTPAVGGMPRKSAIQYILHHEGYARGWYTGAVGWFSGAASEFSVAIRSALVLPDHVHAFAGAGIVAGSQAELEWQELNHKIATILELLNGKALA